MDHHCQTSPQLVVEPDSRGGVVIINDKNELEPVSIPTSMIEPDRAFDTTAIWGTSLSGATFIAIDSSELTGSILGIISKANALEHKFTFFDKDLRQNRTGHVNADYTFKVPHIPSNLSDPNKSEVEDIPVFTLIAKAIPFEFESDPPMLKVGDVDAITAFQLIEEAAAIIGEARQLPLPRIMDPTPSANSIRLIGDTLTSTLKQPARPVFLKKKSSVEEDKDATVSGAVLLLLIVMCSS
jgi:hypothetical protein